MVDQRLVGDVDLLALEEGRYRNDDRELLMLAAEVVGHGQDRAVTVAHQDHLGCLVEKPGVGLGDVEAAEGFRPHREQGQHEEEDRNHATHQTLLSSEGLVTETRVGTGLVVPAIGVVLQR